MHILIYKNLVQIHSKFRWDGEVFLMCISAALAWNLASATGSWGRGMLVSPLPGTLRDWERGEKEL